MTTTNNKRDFSQGKIYRIEPVCEFDEGDIYIGSTTQDLLCKRFRNHRSLYGYWKNGKGHKTTSFDLFDKYGVDNCKIVLIENVNATNLDELTSREAYYIRTLKCVNKLIPLRTKAEWRKDNEEKLKNQRETKSEGKKEYDRHYREVNKDMINEYHHQYYEDNKEILNEKHREFYEQNKQPILERHRQYWERNKKAINEKRRQNYLKKKQENENK